MINVTDIGRLLYVSVRPAPAAPSVKNVGRGSQPTTLPYGGTRRAVTAQTVTEKQRIYKFRRKQYRVARASRLLWEQKGKPGKLSISRPLSTSNPSRRSNGFW